MKIENTKNFIKNQIYEVVKTIKQLNVYYVEIFRVVKKYDRQNIVKKNKSWIAKV